MLDFVRHAIRDALLSALDIDFPDACVGEPSEPEPEPTRHEKALAWLHGLWESGVKEPPGEGFEKIDDLIRGPKGLGWNTADARNWTPDAAYSENGMFAWCGATQARALGEVGLDARIRYKHCASTLRLYNFCKGTDRDIAISDMRPGDIAVVTAGKKKQGEHIVMVEAIDRDTGLVRTIEGNAKGFGPDSRVYEGVVKRTRPLAKKDGGPGRDRNAKCPISGLSQRSEIAHVYRFLDTDFD